MNVESDYSTFFQTDLSENDVQRIRQARIIGVDTETTGLDIYRDVLAIVQISDRDKNTNLIKTDNWNEAPNLRKVLESAEIVKVFHFAAYDCSMLSRHLNIQVANPYCTKIASKIARTYSGNHSLEGIVEEFFQIKLDKTQQTSFWMGDISKEQKRYLLTDVTFLIEIKKRLESILIKKGLLPTGKSYLQLNSDCQAFIPTLVDLWRNGWIVSGDERKSVFGY